MPIDPTRAVGASLPLGTFGWDEPSVILYHLGVGAGAESATSPAELRYLYERDLLVLPSLACTIFPAGADGLLEIPGLEYDPTRLLHAEHELVLTQALPTSGSVTGELTIAAVHDKGKAALVNAETTAVDAAGQTLWRETSTIFMGGAGGFGGDPGPRTADPTPSRDPDLTVHRQVSVQQAALYRLNGDVNPLHIDPDFAAQGGFDTPILHGLCTYGIALKAAVDELLGGDPTHVRRYAVRFAGVVLPGETLSIHLWREADRIHLIVDVDDRNAPALRRGVIDLEPQP